MKYAITCEHHEVFQHFGKTPSFMLVDIDGQEVTKQLVSTDGKGHGALVGFLREHHVQTLVCGGIGQGARDALSANAIALIAGANGNIDDIIAQIQNGTLQDNPSGMCNHHHEGKAHSCASHDCSK